ncbi:glycosyltransferase [Caulobacter sp. 17J80-11]|uniref:glycosyltransferase n=1 Tax=Caulobacter sp. 17J80-11 TaxID=2763502 RepID=UPI0016534507|nr:glycosyltransferase [Caulobacter sp. 17J80-11]
MTAPRPRLLFAIPTLRPGGAERAFSTLIAHLDTDRFDVRLAVFDATGAGFLQDVPAAVDVVDLRAPRIRQGVAPFVRLVRGLRPDAVVSTLEHLNQALCVSRPAWPRSAKHVVRLANVMQLASPASRAAVRALYPFADGLIFQSQAMRAAYEARLGLRHARAAVIENPLAVELIRARAADAAVVPGYRSDGINLLAIGRYEPVKGFDLLAEALARTPPSVTLTVLGDGPDRAQFEAQIARLGIAHRVRLAGYHANPYPFIARADALVLSSRSEGFPNVVLEALALGTPVVATPVAGLETFLRDTPRCQVARDISADALAEALDQFVAAPRGRTPPDVVAPFEASAVARRWEAYLLDVIAA